MRVFIIDNREFPDTDPKMAVDDVRQYYVTYFPELANAETNHTVRDSKTVPGTKEDVYGFKKRVGNKGKVGDENLIGLPDPQI